MQALEFSGLVTSGKLPREVSEKIASTIRKMEGKRVCISIKEQKRRRSNQQNRYMWGVVIAMITDAFREAGNAVDAEDVFAFMKAHVWKIKQVFVTPDGELLTGPGSTRIWSTTEMEKRLEEARAWAAEVLDIKIPLPHECMEAA